MAVSIQKIGDRAYRARQGSLHPLPGIRPPGSPGRLNSQSSPNLSNQYEPGRNPAPDNPRNLRSFQSWSASSLSSRGSGRHEEGNKFAEILGISVTVVSSTQDLILLQARIDGYCLT